MHRSICTGNRLCFRHDLQLAWDAHEQHLQRAKSVVDTSKPIAPLLSPSKKHILQEQQLDRID